VKKKAPQRGIKEAADLALNDCGPREASWVIVVCHNVVPMASEGNL
jgi:hypothetical protein